jgi:peptide/nickel transport system substrate-binding protein
MTQFWIPQPEHVFSGKDFSSIAADPLASQKPIGWGPYLVQEWVAGDHITLAKNPAYFRAAEGLPKVDFVNIRFLNNTAEQSLEALLTGACDVLDESTLLDEQISTILELQQAGKLKAAVRPSAVWEGLYFGIVPSSYDDGFAPNMGDRQDLFGDPRTRVALSMCINRQKIIDDYLGGVSQIPPSYLEAGNPLAESITSPVTYDPDRGAALLDEAGWKDMDINPLTPRVAVNIPTVFLGTPLQLTYYTTNAELRKQVSVQIASDLAACGVPVDLKYMDADSLFAPGPDGVLFGRKFDLAQFSWVPSTMPACRFYTTGQINTAKNYWFGVNIDGYTSEAFDNACQTASNALPGQEGYEAAQKTPQELFNTAIPALPLYQLLRIGVTSTNICGYGMDSTSRSSLWNLENMDSSPGCVGE